jgi:hypothetical protein
MSNRQQDDFVQFKAEENELRTGTETCTLVTILESKEREKGNNDSESSLETEMEVRMEAEKEAETEVETAFSFIRMVFSVRRTGNSVFLWEGGITF